MPQDDLDQILDATSSLWEKARGTTIFITGGTGFFGSWLVESFCHANEVLGLGARVILLSRDPGTFLVKSPHLRNRPDIGFIQGAISSFDLPEVKIDYVIHAATDAAAGTGDDRQLLDTILAGTRRTLELARQSGARSLLFASSGAAYGTQPPDIPYLVEGAETAPSATEYGRAKLAAEQYACEHAASHGYSLKTARCFAFTGPHLPLDSVYAIGNFIRDAMSRTPIVIRGDGRTVRSYLYAADLAIWLWTVLFNGRSGRIYNVGSSEEIDLASLATLVNEVLGNPAGIRILTPADSAVPPSRYVPSTTRARDELGLFPRVALDQAILKTARWHQAAPPVTAS